VHSVIDDLARVRCAGLSATPSSENRSIKANIALGDVELQNVRERRSERLSVFKCFSEGKGPNIVWGRVSFT
jgi:hypothetical protein